MICRSTSDWYEPVDRSLVSEPVSPVIPTTDMYGLTEPLDASVDPATSFLVSSTCLATAERFVTDMLAAGLESGACGIAVTATTEAEGVRDAVYDRTHADESALSIIDCVTRDRGACVNDTDQITYVASPAELTQIGVALSERLEAFEREGVGRARITLHSVSTLLAYADLETVFRFLHVFTRRAEHAGGIGLYTVDRTAHDDRSLRTLAPLFDATIQLSEDGDEIVATLE